MKSLRTCLFLAVLAALSHLGWEPPALAAASAPAPRETPPPASAAPAVRIPSFADTTLPNGLRVIVVEQHEQPALTLRLLLPAGRVFDPQGKAGLAEAAAALLNQGAAGRTAQQIAAGTDFVGAKLSTHAGLDSAYIWEVATSDQLDLGLQLLSEVVRQPDFPAPELERYRQKTLSQLRLQQEEPDLLAGNALGRLVFGAHPYGNPGTGTPDSLRALTRDDLVAFHRSHYRPNGTLLAVVGDVDPKRALARVEAHFGGWPRGAEVQAPAPAVPQRSSPLCVVLDRPDAVQTEIRVGRVGLDHRDPSYFAGLLFNGILGGSPDSRLEHEVRDKRGLTYGVYSDLVAPQQPGPFIVATSTKTESTVEALRVLLDTLEGLGKDPVPPAELDAAKTYLTGSLPLEIETPDGIADKVLDALRYGYGRDYLESYNTRIEAVRAGEVQRFARERIGRNALTLVLVGNAKLFRDDLERSFGPCETLPASEVDLLRLDLRGGKPAPTPAPTP